MERRILLTGEEGLSLILNESDLYTRKIQIGGVPIDGFEHYLLSERCPSHLDVINVDNRIISYLKQRGTPIHRKQPQLEEIDERGLGKRVDQLHRTDFTYDIDGVTFNFTRCYNSEEGGGESLRYTRVVASCLKGEKDPKLVDKVVREMLASLKDLILWEWVLGKAPDEI